MKKRFTRLLFLAAMMAGLLMPQKAQAGDFNEYLQQFENYSVMSMGGNVLRFEIPVWVYCNTHSYVGDQTYYLNPHTANNDNKRDSYLWFSEKKGDKRGSSTVHRIVSFGGAGGYADGAVARGQPRYGTGLYRQLGNIWITSRTIIPCLIKPIFIHFLPY